MKRQVFRWDKTDGKVKPIEEIEESIAVHGLVTDDIPPTVSHATDEGKVFTSRSQLLRHYKENGFECTGGDHLTGKSWMDCKPKSNLEDIRKDLAINLNAMKWGSLPLDEREKEICHREQRSWEDYKRRQR